MRPTKFLEIVKPKGKGGESPNRMGTISAGYVSGRPTVQFDNEPAPSAKAYPYCSRYTPSAGDRVLLVPAGNSWVIVDKIN